MLTPKQEQFAQSLAQGLDQAEAYRLAYGCQDWKPSSVWSKSSQLASNAKVRQRIEELRKELSEKALWKREDSVRVLVEVINDGESRASEKTSAVKVLNEMHGYNEPVKVEHSGIVGIQLNVNFV
jgi:phage terminase small subunit